MPSMRIACAQLGGQDLGSAAERRRTARTVIDAIEAVDVIVLPELWPVGFFHFEEYAAEAEPLNGATEQLAAEVAQQRSCWVHGGSYVERAGSGALYNTSVLMRPDGKVALRYRKRHLFGFRSRETELLTAGTGIGVAEIPVPGHPAPRHAVRKEAGDSPPGDLTAGISTCYDLRFPELYRELVDAGADLLLVTSAWPAARIAHWRLLTRARALENLSYLVACNAAGSDAGTSMGGHSVIVDPFGEVVAEAGDGPEVLIGEIDPALPAKLRGEFPFLADRR